MKYAFPAIFESEEQGYSVIFPDFEGCYTCGDSIADAMYMAEDALCIKLLDYLENDKPIPNPSKIDVITAKSGFVNYVMADVDAYGEKYGCQETELLIKIPKWMNTFIEKYSIDYEHILKNGINELIQSDGYYYK